MELLQAESQRQSEHHGFIVVFDSRDGRRWECNFFRVHRRVRVSVRFLQGPNSTARSAARREHREEHSNVHERSVRI